MRSSTSLVARQEMSAETSKIATASFFLLIAGGQVLFPIMLICIFLFRNLYSKSWIFLNWCFTWVIYSISFSILLYANKVSGSLPSFNLCLFQALLVYMVPILTSSALVALIYHLWTSISLAMKREKRRSLWVYRVMLAGPYLVSAVPAIIASIAISQNPELVEREEGDFYCSVDYHPLRVTVSLMSAFFILTALVLQGIIARTLYVHRLALKQVRVQGWGLVHLFGRICFFMIIALISVTMAFVATVDPENKTRTIYQGCLPLLTFLLFGTRPDFYRKDRDRDTKSQVESTAGLV